MHDTVRRYVAAMASERDKAALLPVLEAGSNLDSSTMLTTAGLVIHGSASTLAKTGAAVTYGFANGVLFKIAGSTDMPALVGSVANAAFNVFCFFIDASGNATSAIGSAGTSLATIQFPSIPIGQTMVGFLIINPTGTGAFIGGTTALDDATVVPGVVYISPTGAFDPSVIVR